MALRYAPSSLAAKPHVVDLAALGSGALLNGIGLFPTFHVASLPWLSRSEPGSELYYTEPPVVL
jgi:hypothetical protein